MESAGHTTNKELTQEFVSSLEGKNYPVVFSRLAIAAASGFFSVSKSARRLVEGQTSLWDPKWRDELTIPSLVLLTAKRVRHIIEKLPEPATRSEDYSSKIDQLLAVLDADNINYESMTKFEKLADELIVFRSKTDKNIRRTRLYDCCLLYLSYYSDLRSILLKLYLFDQISLMNILYGRILLSYEASDWFDFMDELGAFSHGLDSYVPVSKAYSDVIKTWPSPSWMLRWVEVAGFTGYRNPPFPGFDYVKETKDLVSGDEVDHTLRGLPTFTEILHTELNFEVTNRPEFITFHDYVTSGHWVTSGSSNIGYLNLKIDVEEVRVKARKNLLPDILDLENLYKECCATKEQQNKSMIKSELGKVRIASSSDLHNYLLMSWVDYLLNHCYANIEGSTIDERPNEQINRLIKMTSLLQDCYTLPFDYKNFDHQASTPEILDIVAFICSKARKTVPLDHLTEFDLVVSNILSGFNNAFMSTTAPVHVFKVVKGLCSGLRWTSLVGNIWNTVVTKKVQILCEALSSSKPITDRFIRGDDSAIYTKGYYSALLVRLAYTSLGVLADDNKFGVLYEKMEFLRQFFTRDRIYAYPARNIPGLSQRKPWSSSKWDPNDTMSNLYDLTQLLKRRGLSPERCDRFWYLQKQLWSIRLKLPAQLLCIPVNLGGIGIEPWDGKYISSPLFPTVPLERIDLTNSTSYRYEKIKRDLMPYIHVDTTDKVERLKREVRLQQAEVVVGNDVIAINRKLRDAFNLRLSKYRSIQALAPFAPQVLLVPASTVLDDSLIASIPCVDNIYSSFQDHLETGSFGRFPYLDGLWKDLSLAKRIDRSFKPMDYLKTHHLDLYQAITSRSLGHLHRADAIDWLSGKLPGVKRTVLNPLLTPIWTKLTAATIRNPGHFARRRGDLYLNLTLYASRTEELLLNSELHQRLLSW